MNHASRPADASERSRMRALLAEALAEGARGLTTGLTYQSSVFADTAEIVEIAKALRPYGYAYHTHMRDYGLHCSKPSRSPSKWRKRQKSPW